MSFYIGDKLDCVVIGAPIMKVKKGFEEPPFDLTFFDRCYLEVVLRVPGLKTNIPPDFSDDCYWLYPVGARTSYEAKDLDETKVWKFNSTHILKRRSDIRFISIASDWYKDNQHNAVIALPTDDLCKFVIRPFDHKFN